MWNRIAKNLKLVRIGEKSARAEQQPAQEPMQTVAKSRLAMLRNPVVFSVEIPDGESRREQIAKILSDGVYAWLKERRPWTTSQAERVHETDSKKIARNDAVFKGRFANSRGNESSKMGGEFKE